MHATLPLLEETDFPGIRRRRLETLQVNMGFRCNQQCVHCHVNAGPKRKEEMSRATADEVLDFLRVAEVETLDITGGAPELVAHVFKVSFDPFAGKLGIFRILSLAISSLQAVDR